MSGKISRHKADPHDETRVPSIALTRPPHVREAAAMLFNRYHKQWSEAGRRASATEVRALAALLSLTRVTLMGVELDRRMSRLEDLVRAKLGDEPAEAEARAAGARARRKVRRPAPPFSPRSSTLPEPLA